MAASRDVQIKMEIKPNVDTGKLQQYLNRASDLTTAEQAKLYKQLTGKDPKIEYAAHIRVNSSGVKEVIRDVKLLMPELDDLKKQADKLSRVELGSKTNLKQSIATLTQMRDEIQKIDPVTGKITARWQELDTQIQQNKVGLAQLGGNIMDVAKAKFPIIGEVMKLGNQFTQIVAIVKGVAEVFQFVAQVMQPVIDRAKQIEALKLSFQAIGLSVKDAGVAMDSAMQVALSYGVSLAQVEKGYQRLTPSIMANGGSLKTVEETMTAVAARTTALGLTSEQSGRYLEAFAQVLGKGKLQSEELNQQFSELDGALRSQLAAYFALNEGIYDMTDAMAQGEISAEMFREAFVKINEGTVDKLKYGVDNAIEGMRSFGLEGEGAFKKIAASQGATIAQIENMKKSLDTVTLTSLTESTKGFGTSIQAIGVHWSKFWASSSQQFTSFKEALGGTLDIIGGVFEILSHVAGIVVKIIGWAAEVILKLSGWGYALQNGGKMIQWIADKVGWIADKLNPVKTQLAGVTEEQAKLKLETINTKEALSNYVMELAKQKTTADDIAKQKEKEHEQEVKKLEELQAKMNEFYKKEQENIKESIEALREKEKETKDKYKEQMDAEKARHSNVMENLKAELQSVKDKYATLIEAAQQETFAQREVTRLRKEKLQAIISSSKASYEEKINAQAQLDSMNQQAKVAELRKQQKEEEKKINEKIAAEEKAHRAAMKALQEEQKDAIKDIAKEIKNLTLQLKESENKQREANKEIENAKDLNKDLYDSVEDVNEAVSDQVEKVTDVKNAYHEAAKEANEIAAAIGRAAEHQARLNRLKRGGNSGPTTEPKFAGGPVTGGRKYTVNELGVEGFLSAAGKLSTINAPAYGQWRAPGTGTIIPAHIYASIRAAEVFNGSPAPASGFSGGNGLIKAINNLPSSGPVTNNVTVQAINPSKTASDMLVSLTKIRRNRYS